MNKNVNDGIETFIVHENYLTANDRVRTQKQIDIGKLINSYLQALRKNRLCACVTIII